MTDEEKVKEYVKEKISDMKINGFTLLEIAHLSNGANIYNPKVEHLLNDKIKEAYLDGLYEGRKESCNDTRKIQYIPIEEMAERYAFEHSCRADGCRLVMAAFKAGYEKK